jgi:hypothetical protein
MDRETRKDRPPAPQPGPTRRQDRLAREAEALRANLRKRKDQARARAQTDDETPRQR